MACAPERATATAPLTGSEMKDAHMQDILIVGGGFAGVWAAASAARLNQQNGRKLSIALVCPGNELVMRPAFTRRGPKPWPYRCPAS